MAALFLAGNATDRQLTTAWNVNAAYEHFWNPRWRTSLYGGYAAVSYNNDGNAMLCLTEDAGSTPVQRPGRCCIRAATTTGALGGSAHAPNGTSPRTSIWAST